MLPYNAAGFRIKLPPPPPVPPPREPASPSVTPSSPILAPKEPMCCLLRPTNRPTRCAGLPAHNPLGYKEWLSIDPVDQLELNEVADAPTFIPRVSKTTTENHRKTSSNPFYSFINVTIFRLFAWFYQSTSKSLSDITSLIRNVIHAPDFDPDHFVDNFDAAKAVTALDKVNDSSLLFSSSSGWYETSVTIKLPQTGIENVSKDEAPEFKVTGVYHHDLLDIVISAFQDTSFFDMHLKGFTEMWKPGNSQASERVFGEAYTSDIYLAMEDEISSLPSDGLETVVVLLMGYSDSMHLTNFGTAALWPIYLAFGLLSKYIRAQPTSGSSHHLAYMPVLPDTIQDAYSQYFGWPASPAILTYLKHELFHAIWKKLLSPRFKDAYINGIIILCADNIRQRIFPQFFTYSADYPEKALLASIKNLGKYLCLQCLIPKEKVHEMGTVNDMKHRKGKQRADMERHQWWIKKVQSWIYRDGDAVDGKTVNTILNRESLSSTRNAFSLVLSLMFNFYQIVMELTLFKSSTDDFGWYQHLDEEQSDDSTIMSLTSKTLQHHAHAKLRMHTKSSLSIFTRLTSQLRSLIRKFKREVDPLDTREIHKERDARARREINALKKKGKTIAHVGQAACKAKGKISMAKLKKKFSLSTYKYHAMGDYPAMIRAFGMTDSYSTQSGELEHQCVKQFYGCMNKSKTFTKQISLHVQRQQHLHEMQRKIDLEDESQSKRPMPAHNGAESLPYTDPRDHHHISASTCTKTYLNAWLCENSGDVACMGFLSKLKDHLLSRLLGGDEFSDLDRQNLIIMNNCIYLHQILRINYTTYDVWRNQDSINPHTRSNIMMLACEDSADDQSHPYLYARVIGIFHATVRLVGTQNSSQNDSAKSMEFLWDWLRYYVNIFVDHDMFKCYCSDGVGHKNTQEHTIRLWHELLDAFGLLQSEDLSDLDSLDDNGEQKDDDLDDGNDNDNGDNEGDNDPEDSEDDTDDYDF
ncbi:uncharacterized protein ARMOST_14255 [Armillaria ostoyae]|uniref:Uncharacterized protein n=1 Tax=Armillaria ostoyae TaxID=47428 RepID=A0A284RQ34_ARMOS|nr:uncharacterized protein ARMOST_14255 [Armillaria ostoyae]